MSQPTQAVEYTTAWQETRHWTHEWSRRALLAALAHLGIPRTLVDLGCGEGHLVKFAARLGIRSVGVDITLPDAVCTGESFVLVRGDLREPLRLAGTEIPQAFDLVLCWEVAEHLPPQAAEQLVSTVTQCTAPRGLLLFTAATPGQGGHGHVNEQPRAYWIDRLVDAGMTPLREEALRATWTSTCGPCQWYPQNLMMFRRHARATHGLPAPPIRS